ncbi:hypothetical protein WJX74_003914 [Apatococcus lobatus]|uniref:Uncharacterized protein n=1 Tax=Apatococcus lobatus TaxID=904363 RepID=A0AAW1RET0_9CHLO
MIKDQIAMSSGASHDQVFNSAGTCSAFLEDTNKERCFKAVLCGNLTARAVRQKATSVSAHSSAVVEPHWPAAVQR